MLAIHNKRFAIVREMLETPRVVREFPAERASEHAPRTDRVFLTGEGSSRIYPAGHARVQNLRQGAPLRIELEGGEQAAEYDLSEMHLYATSNSGRTAEIVALLNRLRQRKDGRPLWTTAVVANSGSPIGALCDREFTLTCGTERAVAATKSVVEQALFFDIVFAAANGDGPPDLSEEAAAIEEVLTGPIDSAITRIVGRSRNIYFAGRNDGVAEELALKAIEIARKPGVFLEGTLPVHGVEEVMTPDDVLILVDPFPAQEAKFAEVLEQGVGLPVVAISAHATRFPTIRVPERGRSEAYVQLAAGWSMLVEAGLERGIDMDKPVRARKIGNEVLE